MTDQTRALFQAIEDDQRAAKERAAILITHFEAAASSAASETDDDIGMFAAFGFEHLTRQIITALDAMLLNARALADARDEKGGQQ